MLLAWCRAAPAGVDAHGRRRLPGRTPAQRDRALAGLLARWSDRQPSTWTVTGCRESHDQLTSGRDPSGPPVGARPRAALFLPCARGSCRRPRSWHAPRPRAVPPSGSQTPDPSYAWHEGPTRPEPTWPTVAITESGCRPSAELGWRTTSAGCRRFDPAPAPVPVALPHVAGQAALAHEIPTTPAGGVPHHRRRRGPPPDGARTDPAGQDPGDAVPHHELRDRQPGVLHGAAGTPGSRDRGSHDLAPPADPSSATPTSATSSAAQPTSCGQWYGRRPTLFRPPYGERERRHPAGGLVLRAAGRLPLAGDGRRRQRLLPAPRSRRSTPATSS